MIGEYRGYSHVPGAPIIQPVNSAIANVGSGLFDQVFSRDATRTSKCAFVLPQPVPHQITGGEQTKMDDNHLFYGVGQALKLSSDIEEEKKLQGLSELEVILAGQSTKLSEYGYTEVIFKELNKLAKFESGDVLVRVANLLNKFYSGSSKYQDDLMETLIYRYGLTTDGNVSLECLKQISSLIDRMEDNVAKHSKQLLQLAGVSCSGQMKLVIVEILEKLQKKLPERKKPSC